MIITVIATVITGRSLFHRIKNNTFNFNTILLKTTLTNFHFFRHGHGDPFAQGDAALVDDSAELPPNFESLNRTSATVRVGLSVSAWIMRATPPGPYAS